MGIGRSSSCPTSIPTRRRSPTSTASRSARPCPHRLTARCRPREGPRRSRRACAWSFRRSGSGSSTAGCAAADREAEMSRFRDGELDVLVGTTVIEVGVDVPEATMMVVLEADRFGLSQLHQLRGRVGRGSAASFCVLVSDAASDSVARARLEAAAGDARRLRARRAGLELRGEGDLLGLAQSGLPRLRVASLASEDHRALAAGIRDTGDEPPRRGRRARSAVVRARGRADERLAGARRRGRRRRGGGRRCLRPAASSPAARGELRLAVAGRRARVPSATASSRRSSGSLEAERDDAWDVTLLDLFAGSGAAAIEALSRGAPGALFVEPTAGRPRVVRAQPRPGRRSTASPGRPARRDRGPARGRGDPRRSPGPVRRRPPRPAVRAVRPARREPDLGRRSTPRLARRRRLRRRQALLARSACRRSPARSRLARERRFGETALSVYRRGTEPEGSDSR